jgi:hypothetical protein
MKPWWKASSKNGRPVEFSSQFKLNCRSGFLLNNFGPLLIFPAVHE